MSEIWPLKGTGLDEFLLLQCNRTISRWAGGPI